MADPHIPGAPVTDAQEPVLPESLFDGRYHIVRALGAGGFGRVYLAVDNRLGRDVAIKELLADRQRDRATYDRYLERFQREARAGSSLTSQNIVTVYDLHVDAGGNYYLVLEYVEGQDLSDLLAQVGVLPLERALSITLDVARALDQVHEQDIVHRDIKPANILITVRGIAKLSDFGLAQVAHESQRSQMASRHPGTPVYMSPEQRVGFGYIDGRSDLYSLGLVLYEMLTGRRFGETGEPLARARPDLPPAIIAVVDKLLKEDRDDRYQSARALIRDLTYLAEHPEIPVSALPGFRPHSGAPAPAPPALPGAGPSVSAGPRPVPPAPVGVAPPVLAPPAPARGGSGRIALIAAGAVCMLLIAAFLVIVMGRGNHRATTASTAPIETSAPAAAAPTARAGTAAAPTAPEVGAATPTIAPSLATKAAPAAATAASVAVTTVPGTNAPGGDPRIPIAPSSVSSTPDDPTRHTNSGDTSAPAPDLTGAMTMWNDPNKLLQIGYLPGWKPNDDQTMPAKILAGPNNTSLSLTIRDLAPGMALADEIQQQRRTFDEDPKFRYQYDALLKGRIGNEDALSFRFTYAPRDQPGADVSDGQVWVVNHGGKEYVFTARSIGASRRDLETIIASVVFL